MLTNFNGQTITYDEIGNPLQYRDGMSFTWSKGRQLQGITKDGLNAGYTYDENGLRISKTVNGITTKIFRTNGQQVGMNISDGKDVTFILDGDGKVYGIHYDHYSASGLRPETYYFAFNAQGDVIGIYDFGGRLMATYDYDEWGNCTVNVLSADSNGHAIDSPDHVAYVNPFRYRGYFYDAETGFYYLNSRYYDPGTGRFVNADGFVQTQGGNVLATNMFSYCENNPCGHSDSNGEWAGLDDLIAAAAGAIVGVASQLISDVVASALTGSWQFSSWETYVGAAVGGAVGGVVSLYASPVVGAAVGGGVSTLVGQTLERATGKNRRSAPAIIFNASIDASISATICKLIPVKVQGVTAGRNSMSAVFSSGLTKIGRGTASRMSAKVFGKGIASGIVSDLGISTSFGIFGALEEKLDAFLEEFSAHEPICWCVA